MEQFTDLALDTLPNEILFEIFAKMNVTDILNLCKTRSYLNFCDNEDFWIYLLERHYPDFPLIGDPKTHYKKIHDDKGDLYRWGAHSIKIPGNHYPAGTTVRRLNVDLYHFEADGSIFNESEFYFGTDVADDIEEGITTLIRDLLKRVQELNNEDPNMTIFPSILTGSIRKEKLDWDEEVRQWDEDQEDIEINEHIRTFDQFSILLNQLLDEYGLRDDMIYELFLEERELAIKIQLNHIFVHHNE
jgi:hypothetical protein